jgi:hypothetical protein
MDNREKSSKELIKGTGMKSLYAYIIITCCALPGIGMLAMDTHMSEFQQQLRFERSLDLPDVFVTHATRNNFGYKLAEAWDKALRHHDIQALKRLWLHIASIQQRADFYYKSIDAFELEGLKNKLARIIDLDFLSSIISDCYLGFEPLETLHVLAMITTKYDTSDIINDAIIYIRILQHKISDQELYAHIKMTKQTRNQPIDNATIQSECKKIKARAKNKFIQCAHQQLEYLKNRIIENTKLKINKNKKKDNLEKLVEKRKAIIKLKDDHDKGYPLPILLAHELDYKPPHMVDISSSWLLLGLGATIAIAATVWGYKKLLAGKKEQERTQDNQSQSNSTEKKSVPLQSNGSVKAPDKKRQTARTA